MLGEHRPDNVLKHLTAMLNCTCLERVKSTESTADNKRHEKTRSKKNFIATGNSYLRLLSYSAESAYSLHGTKRL